MGGPTHTVEPLRIGQSSSAKDCAADHHQGYEKVFAWIDSRLLLRGAFCGASASRGGSSPPSSPSPSPLPPLSAAVTGSKRDSERRGDRGRFPSRAVRSCASYLRPDTQKSCAGASAWRMSGRLQPHTGSPHPNSAIQRRNSAAGSGWRKIAPATATILAPAASA